MKNNNNSSSLSHHLNPNDHNPHDQCHNPKLFICEFCHKVFSTGQALGGHKTSHRSNKQIRDDDHHVNKVYKTIKITFSLSSPPSYHSNDVDAKPKRHSWTRVYKSTVHHPPTASTLNPTEQQDLLAVDLLSLLPPRITKKRSRRYVIHHGLANNNTAPMPSLLDVSHESVANLDVNHGQYKRMKLSSHGNMQKQHVLPTSDGIDETLVKEEKKLNEGETVLGPRGVRNLDLNELPRNDVETELGQRVVRDLDLNELPTNDVAD